MTDARTNGPVTVGGVTVKPGRKVQFELPFARVATGATESLPVKVINGRSPGPHVWLSAAIHGDELNGIQIIRRVIRELDSRSLRGAVIAVPIVNPLGFIIQSRYLPDRRDLNRSFPGSARGSTASRLAHLFMDQIVAQCSVGFDLHTATDHRTNIPQIRANLDDPATLKLARAFGAPYSVHARLRDGSLRQAAAERNKTILVYEGGQANRFEDDVIEVGVNGILRTLRAMKMVAARLPRAQPTQLVRTTRWMRARRGGIAEVDVKLGDFVREGDQVAAISDAFGIRPTSVKTSETGWVIGRSLHPMVISGDPLVHIGSETGLGREGSVDTKR